MANVMGNGRIVNEGLIRVCRDMGQNCGFERAVFGGRWVQPIIREALLKCHRSVISQ